MKTYHGGYNQAGQVIVWVTDPDDTESPARELTQLPAPSDGLAYGPQSSGTQDLAFALLADCLGETPLPDTPEQETLLADRVIAGEALARDVIARLDPEIP